MIKYSVIKTFLIILMIAVLLTSCLSKNSDIFKGGCSAPCWRGIIPGETKKSDVLNAVKGFSDVNHDSMSLGGKYKIFDSFIVFDLYNGTTIEMDFIENVVLVITFEKTGGIEPIKNCENYFGVPEYFARSYLLGFGPPIGATSAIHPWYFAISPNKGIVFGYDAYSIFGTKSTLSSNTMISYIGFFDIRSYKRLIDNGILIFTDISEYFSENNLYVWKGYGKLNELYPNLNNK
jgi:hypothetical protein